MPIPFLLITFERQNKGELKVIQEEDQNYY